MMANTTILTPVVMAVPAEKQFSSPRERSFFLSRLARRAAQRSAELSGSGLIRFVKDEYGAPLPSGNNYWSISHKPEKVAAVISDCRVGIDIEKIREVHKGVYQKLASPAEWHLAGETPCKLVFFRFWTAKEAVLKMMGVGLKGLSGCFIQKIISPDLLEITFNSQHWLIEQYRIHDHIVSVVKVKPEVRWHAV